MAAQLKTPGVFINEVNAFPSSIVPVETAVPAFIGYTARASRDGKDLTGQPTGINSLSDFLRLYGTLTEPTDGTPPIPADEKLRYTPRYHVVAAAQQPGDINLAGKAFDLRADPSTIYYLYPSIQLFYANGGGKCLVVSAGPYGSASGQTPTAGEALVNPNVKYTELKAGLDSLANELTTTLIVVPDALLLKFDEYQMLLQDILHQCGTLRSRMGIFDVYGGEATGSFQPDRVEHFRTAVGTDHLAYGAAYYPFLQTTITPDDAVNCVTFGGPTELATLLPGAGQDPVKSILSEMNKTVPPNGPIAEKLEKALLLKSPAYKDLQRLVLQKMNILPAGGAIAGMYARVDSAEGVWKAPANASLVSVIDTTVHITDQIQGGLNVDASSGKSINAIRTFVGRGLLVWGARTLDGNSSDWRYISVRRTTIMVEQSVRLGMAAYVYEPNSALTWSTIKSMLESFLTQLWKQGALAGAVPKDAFFVQVGLGTTMTEQDILNGLLRVTIGVAVLHPAEFILMTLQQQMQPS